MQTKVSSTSSLFLFIITVSLVLGRSNYTENFHIVFFRPVKGTSLLKTNFAQQVDEIKIKT